MKTFDLIALRSTAEDWHEGAESHLLAFAREKPFELAALRLETAHCMRDNVQGLREAERLQALFDYTTYLQECAHARKLLEQACALMQKLELDLEDELAALKSPRRR